MKKLLKRLAALLTVAATVFSVTACEDLLGVTSESDGMDAASSASNSVGASSESFTSTQSESLEESITESEDSESIEESTSEEDSESASEEPETPQQALVYDGSEVTVTFYHTMGATQRAVFEESLEAFNKLYPNITVVHESKGSASMLREEITYSLMRNSAPTIAFCAPEDLVYYRNQQALVNLDEELFDSTEKAVAADGKTEMMGFTQAQANDFQLGFLEGERYFGGGALYSLPVYALTSVMYYNKTYFEANRLTVPTTWKEVEEVCAAIKAKKENCCPLAIDGDADLFITRVEQLGEPYLSATGEKLFNTAKNRAMVEELREWYEKGYIITDGIWASYTSDLLQSEDAYMSIASVASSSWYETNAFEVGVAMIPQENANAKVPMFNTSVCLFKQEDLQETAAAWLLMKHLSSSVEYQAGMSMEYGCLPVVRSVLENAAYQEFTQKTELKAQVIKQAWNQVSAYFITPVFEGARQVKMDVEELIIDCLSGKLPSGKTAAEFIKEKFDGITK